MSNFLFRFVLNVFVVTFYHQNTSCYEKKSTPNNFFFLSVINYSSAQQLTATGNNWNLLDVFWLSGQTNNYSIGTDTIIDDVVYQQILKNGVFIEIEDPLAPRFVRETEDGKVYMYGYLYSDTYEMLIYDFGLNLLDTFTLSPSLNVALENKFVVTEVDSITLLDGSTRRQLTLELIESQFNGTMTWIEGVGEKKYGPFYAHAFYVFDFESNLLCAYQDEIVNVYQSPIYDSCFIILTSTDGLANNNSIKIYPNPVKDILILEYLETDYIFTEINILNALGEMVYQDKEPITITEINTSNLNTGIYFLILKDKSGASYSKQIIKQ